MNELALFAGAGGGILAGELLGWRCVCAVEWEAYPASVLAMRQNDGLLPAFPIWDDVRTFDGKPWAGRVDVVSGGFPCQDISAAGRGAGIEAERSGLWREMARIISEVRPKFVFVENSPLLVGRGLALVLGDLAKMGFDARWGVLGADEVGAPHARKRCWVVANSSKNRRAFAGLVPDFNRAERERRNKAVWGKDWKRFEDFQKDGSIPGRWSTEPGTDRMADGVANQVDRLAAIGNGQVPQCAAQAWRLLADGWC
ncbi:MAG: DNA cytosine methyltransferase [Gammaproteobacteria bacterium]|nr:DNA cytosine methyltransferase [Gammaproteobacteria bacterium]MCP5013850.1 DNA cytosine methyltransferase [Ketobacter sp.]